MTAGIHNFKGLIKRYFWLVTLSLVVQRNLLAQQTIPIAHDSTKILRELVVHGSGQIQSNHLTSAISRKILFGGMISDEEIRKSTNNLRDSGLNRTGAVVNLDMVYTDYTANLFGKKQFGYVLTAGHQTYFGSTYQDQAFQLFAQGNANAPQLNDLTDTRFYQMSHHKLGFGILEKKTRSSFSLNFIGVVGYQDFDLMNGVFNQNSNKDTIDLVLIGSLTGNNSAQFLKGVGLGLDVDLRMPIQINKKEIYVQVLAQNLGFVRMNKNSFNYNMDTTYRFSGFDLQQVQNVSNNPDFSLVDSLNITRNEAVNYQWLPGFVQVAKIVNRNSLQRLQAFYGMNLYTHIAYMPQVFAGSHWQATNNLSFGLHGHLGGFGNARLGGYAEMRLGNFCVGLSSQDLLGTAANIGFGHSLLFRLSWQQK